MIGTAPRLPLELIFQFLQEIDDAARLELVASLGATATQRLELPSVGLSTTMKKVAGLVVN